MANIDVAGAFGWLMCICHVQGTIVIFVDEGGMALRDLEFIKNGADVECHLSGVGCCNELGFGRTGGYRRLESCLVGNDATGKFEGDAGDGTTVESISSPVGVNVSEEGCRGNIADVMNMEVGGCTERSRWLVVG